MIIAFFSHANKDQWGENIYIIHLCNFISLVLTGADYFSTKCGGEIAHDFFLHPALSIYQSISKYLSIYLSIYSNLSNYPCFRITTPGSPPSFCRQPCSCGAGAWPTITSYQMSSNQRTIGNHSISPQVYRLVDRIADR